MTIKIHASIMSAEILRKTIILLIIFAYYCMAEDQQEKPIRNSANSHHTLEKTPSKLSSKVSSVTPMSYEYLQTPNFNCLLLPEEKKSAQWKKYASLFDPPRSLSKAMPSPKAHTRKIKHQRRRAQRSNNTQKLTGDTVKPSLNSATSLSLLPTPTTTTNDPILPSIVSISLERRIVEAMFELLEKKNHIIVLQPRNCHTDHHAMMTKDDKEGFRKFAESLLHKLMQRLKNSNGNLIQPTQETAQTVDPPVQRILDQLDHEEELLINKIYNDLADEKPKSLELDNGNCLHCRKKKHADVRRNTFESKSKKNATLSGNKVTNDCDKGYVFLVGSHNDEGKDLLMRAVRIVNKKNNKL